MFTRNEGNELNDESEMKKLHQNSFEDTITGKRKLEELNDSFSQVCEINSPLISFPLEVKSIFFDIFFSSDFIFETKMSSSGIYNGDFAFRNKHTQPNSINGRPEQSPNFLQQLSLASTEMENNMQVYLKINSVHFFFGRF